MGLESASMRQCLLWYNFIVWGTRTVGPKTQTVHWYGGFFMLLETLMCVCGSDVLFCFVFFFFSFERCEQKGQSHHWCCWYEARSVIFSLKIEQLSNYHNWISEPCVDLQRMKKKEKRKSLPQTNAEILHLPHIAAAVLALVPWLCFNLR